MMNTHTILFDSTLKVYLHCLVHLDVIPNAIPRHLRAYPVAQIHLEVFKAELLCLCNIGVLEICGAFSMGILDLYYTKKGWYSLLGLRL